MASRQELEHLRTRAWNTGEDISEISRWLNDAREMSASLPTYQERERDAKITRDISRYRESFNFDAVLALREELKLINAKFRELAKQKKALGLGA
jgi:hypothetical protein